MAEKKHPVSRTFTKLRLPSEGRSLEDSLDERIEALARWLADNAPHLDKEQAHLDADTRERAYWHHGYLCALRDTREFLKRQLRG